MYFRTLIFLLLIAPLVSIGALPDWNSAETNNDFLAGQALLATSIDLDNVEAAPEPLPELPPEPEVVRPLVVQPTPATPELHTLPEANDDRVLLSESILNNYFEQQIAEGFHDPQKVLTAEEIVNTEAALERYSEESPVSIYLYLFDKNQQVPNSYSAENIFNRFYYSQPSAVVVYYFMEEPERCQVHFGGKDSNMIATNKIRDLVSGIRLGAKKRSNRSSQLDEFIRQLSLHMFWIEKAMIEDIYTPLNIENQQTSASSSKATIPEKVVGGLSSFSNYWWIIVLCSLGLIAALLFGVYLVSNRRFSFPRLVVKHRLKLQNGGSSGGILSFKDHNSPPSAQRKQFQNPFE